MSVPMKLNVLLHTKFVCDINTKPYVIIHNISLSVHGVTVLSETWIRNEVNDNKLSLLPNHSTFSSDRGSVIDNSIRDGSILIIIKIHLHFFGKLPILHNSNIEQFAC